MPTVTQLSTNGPHPEIDPDTTENRPRRVQKELLTDRFVRDLPAPPRGATITYDGGDPKRRVSGFGVRVTAAGVRAFVLNYRVRGIERCYTIGKFPEWNVSRARDRAKELKRTIDQGGDPGVTHERCR